LEACILEVDILEVGILEVGILEAGILEAGILEAGILEADMVTSHPQMWSTLPATGKLLDQPFGGVRKLENMAPTFSSLFQRCIIE
jgi:hypothetical protein